MIISFLPKRKSHAIAYYEGKVVQTRYKMSMLMGAFEELAGDPTGCSGLLVGKGFVSSPPLSPSALQLSSPILGLCLLTGHPTQPSLSSSRGSASLFPPHLAAWSYSDQGTCWGLSAPGTLGRVWRSVLLSCGHGWCLCLWRVEA